MIESEVDRVGIEAHMGVKFETSGDGDPVLGGHVETDDSGGDFGSPARGVTDQSPHTSQFLTPVNTQLDFLWSVFGSDSLGVYCIVQRCMSETPLHQPRADPSMFLSDTDRETLLKTLNARSSELIQARMANALLLLAEGLSTEDVAGLLYLDEESVAGWKDMFSKHSPKTA